MPSRGKELPAIDTGGLPATCVLVDDHDVVLQGLRLCLEHRKIVKVKGMVTNGPEAIEALRAHAPHVALVDIRFRTGGMDGIELTRIATREKLPTRIIIFTATVDHTVLERAFEVGARGFIAKDTPMDVVASAVRMVVAGREFVDPTIGAEMLAGTETALTDREQVILRLMADGFTNTMMSHEIGLSEDTIKAHVSSAMRKLDSTSRTAAVANALRRSVID